MDNNMEVNVNENVANNTQETVNTVPTGKTKKCKYCQSIIDKKAKICPMCRKKQKGVVAKILKICLIVLVIFIIGCVALYNYMLKNYANQAGQAYMEGSEYFNAYEIEKGDGGYWIIEYVDDEYGDNMYMKYLLTSTADEDILAMKDAYRWKYYVNGSPESAESFYTIIVTNMYADVYGEVLDTYTDYLNQVLDAFK